MGKNWDKLFELGITSFPHFVPGEQHSRYELAGCRLLPRLCGLGTLCLGNGCAGLQMPTLAASAVAVQSCCRSSAQCWEMWTVHWLTLTMLIRSNRPAELCSFPRASWFAGISMLSPHIAVLTLHTAPLPAQVQATKQWQILGVRCCK